MSQSAATCGEFFRCLLLATVSCSCGFCCGIAADFAARFSGVTSVPVPLPCGDEFSGRKQGCAIRGVLSFPCWAVRLSGPGCKIAPFNLPCISITLILPGSLFESGDSLLDLVCHIPSVLAQPMHYRLHASPARPRPCPDYSRVIYCYHIAALIPPSGYITKTIHVFSLPRRPVY